MSTALRRLNKTFRKAIAGPRYTSMPFYELRDRFLERRGIQQIPLVIPRFLIQEWIAFVCSMRDSQCERIPEQKIPYQRKAWEASRKWKKARIKL